VWHRDNSAPLTAATLKTEDGLSDDRALRLGQQNAGDRLATGLPNPRLDLVLAAHITLAEERDDLSPCSGESIGPVWSGSVQTSTSRALNWG
jgi:hypothetical protein